MFKASFSDSNIARLIGLVAACSRDGVQVAKLLQLVVSLISDGAKPSDLNGLSISNGIYRAEFVCTRGRCSVKEYAL